MGEGGNHEIQKCPTGNGARAGGCQHAFTGASPSLRFRRRPEPSLIQTEERLGNPLRAPDVGKTGHDYAHA